MKIINLKSLTLVLIILLFVSSIDYLTAQDTPTGHYNLKYCIDLAIQNSYQLQADSLLSQSLQMQVKQEQAVYYPQFSGALGFSSLFLSPYTFGQHYLQAIADWDLGKFWYKTGDIKQKQIEKQEAIRQQNKLEILAVITGLYLDVQKNELELQILESRQAYYMQHLNILTVLWKAGTIKKLDILQTQSTINLIKETIMHKELEANQSKYVMARLMGLDSDTGFSLTQSGGIQSLPEITPDDQNIFLQSHPSVITVQKEYEAELLKKKDIHASYLPHIQAFSGYTMDGDPTGDGNFVMLGLGASIPIYQWGKKGYQLHEIDFSSDAIQMKKQNIERELSIKHGQIVKQIQEYEKILNFQQEKIKTDEEVAEVAEVNYKSGLSTNLDFLLAQQTLTETKLNINSVRNRYIKSLVAFYLLTGQSEYIKNIK